MSFLWVPSCAVQGPLKSGCSLTAVNTGEKISACVSPTVATCGTTHGPAPGIRWHSWRKEDHKQFLGSDHAAASLDAPLHRAVPSHVPSTCGRPLPPHLLAQRGWTCFTASAHSSVSHTPLQCSLGASPAVHWDIWLINYHIHTFVSS